MGKTKIKTRETGKEKDDKPVDLPPDKLAIYRRLAQQGDWNPALRDQMMAEARKSGLSREDAQTWTYRELDRMYPPRQSSNPAQNPTETPENQGDNTEGQAAGNGRVCVPPRSADSSTLARVSGLDAIPPAWPVLPGSASLTQELGWVQANRLQVVSETAAGARVDLARAVEPAPSRSALAWLETSIRNYAKFTDVLSRVASASTDEQEDVRRERTALVEIERLLAQMVGG